MSESQFEAKYTFVTTLCIDKSKINLTEEQEKLLASKFPSPDDLVGLIEEITGETLEVESGKGSPCFLRKYFARTDGEYINFPKPKEKL